MTKTIFCTACLLVFTVLVCGCSILDGRKLAKIGSRYAKDIDTEAFWLRALPEPDITRIGYETNLVTKFSHTLCGVLLSTEYPKLKNENSLTSVAPKDCQVRIQTELERIFQRKETRAPLKDLTRESLLRLKEHILVDAYDVFSCTDQSESSKPASLIHAMAIYWGLDEERYAESLNLVEKYNTQIILSTAPISSATLALSNIRSTVSNAYLTLPQLESMANRCASSNILRKLTQTINITLSSIDSDPFDSIRLALMLEQIHQFPPAYVSQIKELVLKTEQASESFNSEIGLAKLEITKVEKDDNIVSTTQLSNRVMLLSDAIKYDLISLGELSRIQLFVQWKYLERLASSKSGAPSLSAALRTTGEWNLGYYSDRLDRLQCIANATQALSIALERFQSVADHFLSRQERDSLLLTIQEAELSLNQKKCVTGVSLTYCQNEKKGKREYFRKATHSIITAITGQFGELASQGSSLSLDDWKIARNILSAQLLQGIDLGLKALASDSSCDLNS